MKGVPPFIINSWGRQLLRNIDKLFAAVPNDTTKPYYIELLNMLIDYLYKSSSDTPWVSVTISMPHRYSYTLITIQGGQTIPMYVLWSDCDIFERRIVCIKSPSIYIFMTRLVNITGLEWAKIYEKIDCVLIWSPQKWASHRCCKPHILNLNKSIVYLS